eukprot:PhF_6_TR31828/c1_g2_i1/m.47068
MLESHASCEITSRESNSSSLHGKPDSYVTDMFPRLSFVARRAGEMIASEASCERMFSQQKMVHTDVRNRLGVEQVEAEVNIRGRVGRTKRDRDQRERTT